MGFSYLRGDYFGSRLPLLSSSNAECGVRCYSWFLGRVQIVQAISYCLAIGMWIAPNCCFAVWRYITSFLIWLSACSVFRVHNSIKRVLTRKRTKRKTGISFILSFSVCQSIHSCYLTPQKRSFSPCFSDFLTSSRFQSREFQKGSCWQQQLNLNPHRFYIVLVAICIVDANRDQNEWIL